MGRFETQRPGELIRRARHDAGLTQAELAKRAELQQPSLALIESGRRRVSGQMLERILRAADYRPSLSLEEHSQQVVELARRRGFSNVRVFGSVARGDDGFHSDIDLLVNARQSVDLFDIALFAHEVEQLTGFRVDVISDSAPTEFLAVADSEAVPL